MRISGPTVRPSPPGEPLLARHLYMVRVAEHFKVHLVVGATRPVPGPDERDDVVDLQDFPRSVTPSTRAPVAPGSPRGSPGTPPNVVPLKLPPTRVTAPHAPASEALQTPIAPLAATRCPVPGGEGTRCAQGFEGHGRRPERLRNSRCETVPMVVIGGGHTSALAGP